MKPRKSGLLIFFVGIVSHLIFWVYTINSYSGSNSWSCGELSCWILVYADFPVSLLYLTGTASTVTFFSAVIGSLWWGLLFWFVSLIIRFLFAERTKKGSDLNI